MIWNRGTAQEFTRVDGTIFSFVFTFVGWIVLLLFFSVLKDAFDAPAEWALGASFAAFGIGYLWARMPPRVKRVSVPLGSSGKTLKIAQISDLHIGGGISAGFIRRMVARVNSLNPDCVVLTGDIGDGFPERHLKELSELGKLSAPVFYVLGNHEYYWDADGWLKAFRGLGFKPLINEGVEYKGVWLAGVPDVFGPRHLPDHKPDAQKALAGAPAGLPLILLCHQPSFSPVAAAAGFNLQISGHTHGGQFIPIRWIVNLVHKHPRGLRREGAMYIYVSQGTGTWGPPVRFGVRSEITALTITS